MEVVWAIALAGLVGLVGFAYSIYAERLTARSRQRVNRGRVIFLVAAVILLIALAALDPSARAAGLLFAIIGASLVLAKWRVLWRGEDLACQENDGRRA